MNNMILTENGKIIMHRIRKDDKEHNKRITPDSIRANTSYNKQLLSLETNDTGNVRRVLLYCGKSIVYDKSKKMLALWNGMYWDYDAKEEIHRLITAVMDNYYEAAINAKNLSKEEHQRLVSHARKSNNGRDIKVILEMLEYYNTIKELKSEPHYLNVLNGVVDLKTKKLYPHEMNYQFTSVCNANYYPDEKSKHFKDFVQNIFYNDKDVIRYVQQAFGYGITGERAEQKIFFMYGVGGNGKSVLVDAISDVLNGFAAVLPTSGLTKEHSNAGAATPELIPLIGKRIAFSNELKGDQTMNDLAVKQLTGDKKISVRYMRKEFISIPVTFKIFVDTNFLPYFKYYDDAIERRVVIIPFNRTFSERTRDNELGKKLREDNDYILKWLVNGAYQYYEKGRLEEPEIIKNAKWEFKDNSDSVGMFIKDKTEECFGGEIASSDLYNIYLAYCKKKSYDPLGRKSFSQAVKKKGIQRVSKRDANYFKNIKVI